MSSPANLIVVHSLFHEYEEAVVASGNTVFPGALVAANATNQFLLNVVAGNPAMIALEDELQGKTVDDTIAAGSRLRAKFLFPGDRVVVTIVDSLTVTKGDLLTASATAGKVGTLLGGATTLAANSVSVSGGTVSSMVSAQLVLRAEAALTNVATERRIICRVLRT